MKSGKNSTPLHTALIYAIFGVLWILLSDTALALFVPAISPSYILIQSVKGWLFVLASAGLLYLILRSDMKSLQERQKHINYQAGLIEDVSDAIISTDRQCRILTWNTAAEHMYGWTASEVIGHTLREFVQNEYFNISHEEIIKIALEQGKWKGEVSQNHKNGRRFFVSTSLSLVNDQDGRSIGFVAINRDITERKHAQEALAVSEAEMRALLASMPDVVLVIDREGVYRKIAPTNPGLLIKPPQELLGKNLRDVFPAEQADVFIHSIQQVLQTQKIAQIEYTLPIEGQQIWFSTSISPMTEDSTLWVARDISERKQADEMIRESEDRYRDLIENSQDLICTHDLEGLILSANPASARTLGYELDELIGRNLRDILAPEVQEHFKYYVSRLRRHGSASGLLLVKTRNGERRIWEYQNTVRREGVAEPVVRGRARDITERKWAEDALRRSQEEYKVLLNTIDGIVWEADANTFVFSFASQQAERLLGYPIEQWTSEPTFWKDHIHADDQSWVVNYCIACTHARISHEFEYRMIAADGHIIWLKDIVTVIVENDQPAKLRGIMVDITESKRAEDEIRRLKEFNENLINNMVEGIMVQNTDGYFTFVNPAASTITGYLPDELVGRHWTKFFHADQHERIKEADNRRLAGEASQYEIDFLHKSGKRINILVSGSPLVENERFNGSMAVFTDITERKQHERELEAIASISMALRKARTLDEMLPRLLDQTLALINAQIGSIWLYDTATNQVNLAMQRGWGEENIITSVRPGEGIPGWVVKSGQGIVTREFSTDPRVLEKNRSAIPKGFGGACIPLYSDENVVGVIFINVKLPREISAGELRVLNALAEIGGNAIHRMYLLEQTLKQLERLRSLRTIDLAISSSLDLRISLITVLEEVTTQLKVDAASVLLINPDTKRLEFSAGRGFRTDKINSTSLKIGEGTAGQVALDKKIVYIKNLNKPDQYLPRLELMKDEEFVSYFGVPLIAKDEVQGVLEIFNRSSLHVNMEWLSFMDSISWQTAIAVDNALLFKNLQRSNSDLESAYNATIEGWSRALDLRDKETEGHSLRVTELTLKLARILGMDDDLLIDVRRGSLLHDIGKMGVPDTILFKPGLLSEEEWRIMRQHPQKAYELLAPISYLRQALDIPYYHHEKWDGTGYPRNLKGEEIPLAARIFAIVDVWDALTSDRPYRPAWSDSKAIEYIRENSGSHFDPQMVEVFLKSIAGIKP